MWKFLQSLRYGFFQVGADLLRPPPVSKTPVNLPSQPSPPQKPAAKPPSTYPKAFPESKVSEFNLQPLTQRAGKGEARPEVLPAIPSQMNKQNESVRSCHLLLIYVIRYISFLPLLQKFKSLFIEKLQPSWIYHYRHLSTRRGNKHRNMTGSCHIWQTKEKVKRSEHWRQRFWSIRPACSHIEIWNSLIIWKWATYSRYEKKTVSVFDVFMVSHFAG